MAEHDCRAVLGEGPKDRRVAAKKLPTEEQSLRTILHAYTLVVHFVRRHNPPVISLDGVYSPHDAISMVLKLRGITCVGLSALLVLACGAKRDDEVDRRKSGPNTGNPDAGKEADKPTANGPSATHDASSSATASAPEGSNPSPAVDAPPECLDVCRNLESCGDSEACLSNCATLQAVASTDCESAWRDVIACFENTAVCPESGGCRNEVLALDSCTGGALPVNSPTPGTGPGAPAVTSSGSPLPSSITPAATGRAQPSPSSGPDAPSDAPDGGSRPAPSDDGTSPDTPGGSDPGPDNTEPDLGAFGADAAPPAVVNADQLPMCKDVDVESFQCAGASSSISDVACSLECSDTDGRFWSTLCRGDLCRCAYDGITYCQCEYEGPTADGCGSCCPGLTDSSLQ